MSLVSSLLSPVLVTRLGWTLLHFVWQGTALAALLLVLLFLLRRRSASARYLACCTVLLLMTLCPPITFLALTPRLSQTALTPGGTPGVADPTHATATAGNVKAATAKAAAAGNATIAFLPIDALPVRPLLERLLPWLVIGWSLGVLLLCLRLVGSSLVVSRLVRRGVRPITGEWEARLRRLAGQMRLHRPIRLLESSRVQVPTVIGSVRAIILLPATMLTGLLPQQIEALLAHELAHIRRYDPLINLWQIALETLLFYHPAVWWVSRQARSEREQCCDDLAVQVVEDRAMYARALASLEALRSEARSFALASDGGDLMARIRHILGLTPLPKPSMPFALAGILLGAALLASLLAWQTPAPRKSDSDAEKSAAATRQKQESSASAPRDNRAWPALLALRQAAAYYRGLSSFSMRIENHFTSGLFPTEYMQTLRWRKPDQFELLITSKNSTQVLNYYADGEQLITVLSDGRQRIGLIKPEPNTAPGWEVSAGLILSWLQNTESGQRLFDDKPLPPTLRISMGPRTKWHGYRVREVLIKDNKISRYYPHGLYTSFFLDATKPKLIGLETNIVHKIGWALYADQKQNPALPKTLGQAPTAR